MLSQHAIDLSLLLHACMHPRSVSHRLLRSTLTPFLYPCLDSTWLSPSRHFKYVRSLTRTSKRPDECRRFQSTVAAKEGSGPNDRPSASVDVSQFDHLDPSPPEFSSQLFTDACTLTVSAGGGGHGCISFLREKYIANGPPNGGDGGTGGSVYIQAVRGETSLHKLARRGILKAGRGRNGQGSLKGGARGEDILITVPVGTVVREISRHDPLEDEEAQGRRGKGYGRDLDDDVDDGSADQTPKWRRDKWLIYPGTLPKSFSTADFPALPRPRRSHLTALQPAAPLRLDLEKPMEAPLLLAAGAMGGLGNPHFVTKSLPRPKFATKGDNGMRLNLHLELKLLADVGLVGLPNAGKSTLLRALTRSRTRVGNWAFTTLSPSIGTVVLDAHAGRPTHNIPAPASAPASSPSRQSPAPPLSNFTIADIPGLIEDAHLDRGLGLGFLKHVERAAVLAFVIDLSAGDAVAALKSLWRELGMYEQRRAQEVCAGSGEVDGAAPEGMVRFTPFASAISPGMEPEPLDDSQQQQQSTRSPLALPAISSKPWLVVATKADLSGTQEAFAALRSYLERVQSGDEEHPSGKSDAWRKSLYSVPVSAINKEGVSGLPDIILRLLHERPG